MSAAAAANDGAAVSLTLDSGDFTPDGGGSTFLVIDGGFNVASELVLRGSSSGAPTILRASSAAGRTSAPLLTIVAGAPPVRLENLVVLGRVDVTSSSLVLSGVTFDEGLVTIDQGVLTSQTRRQRRLTGAGPPPAASPPAVMPSSPPPHAPGVVWQPTVRFSLSLAAAASAIYEGALRRALAARLIGVAADDVSLVLEGGEHAHAHFVIWTVGLPHQFASF